MEDTTKTTCTWQDRRQCAGCSIGGKLKCRWNAMDLIIFLFLTLPSILGALGGTVLIGITQSVWWPMVAYILFFPVVLGIAENRFLCSHCPYYAEEGRVLHCLANHGMPKLWRYHPESMNKLEKWLMVALIIIFLALSLVILGYDIVCFAMNLGVYGAASLALTISLAVVTLTSLVALALVMVKYVCSACVNFSCPFNRVDKATVDAYLEKNPAMAKAWEQAGYKIGAAGIADRQKG